MCDAAEGWCAFAAEYVTALREELAKMPIWINLINFDTWSDSLLTFYEHASVIVPYDASKKVPWESSALQCLPLESLTLPSRSRPLQTTLPDMLNLVLREPHQRFAYVEVATPPQQQPIAMAGNVVVGNTEKLTLIRGQSDIEATFKHPTPFPHQSTYPPNIIPLSSAALYTSLCTSDVHTHQRLSRALKLVGREEEETRYALHDLLEAHHTF